MCSFCHSVLQCVFTASSARLTVSHTCPVRTLHTQLRYSSNFSLDLSASFPLLFSVFYVVVARFSTASPPNTGTCTYTYMDTHTHLHLFQYVCCCFACLFCPWLSWNLLCSPGWPQTHRVCFSIFSHFCFFIHSSPISSLCVGMASGAGMVFYPLPGPELWCSQSLSPALLSSSHSFGSFFHKSEEVDLGIAPMWPLPPSAYSLGEGISK